MKKVGMFYLVPWCARFLRLYTFLKRINIPLVQPLCDATKQNYKQWQEIITMMREDGPVLFVGGVMSLLGESWQAQAQKNLRS
jgi:hypothetical protein